jgi:gliding motility-associated-like protein
MTTLTKATKACFLLLFSLFSALLVKAQPSANFTGNNLAGCAPLVVNFTDQSTGNPNTWRWDLGNGTISVLQNPSVIYINPGQYTIKLVVRNQAGSDSIIRTQYVQVYAKPVVSFSASTTSGCAPLPVSFTDQSVAGSGTLASWQWDFGNGTLSTQRNPSMSYLNSGTYNVTLRATNSHGCIGSKTDTNLITVSNKPVADFRIGPTNNCGAPVNVSFSNLSSGTGQLNYSWNFGDGTTSTESNPIHTYTQGGTFSVRLIVTNATGCTDTIVKTNAFVISNNVNRFTSPATACAGTPVTFTNTSSPAPSGSTWNFGDSTSPSVGNTSSHVFANPGTYIVTLYNNFGTCSDSLKRAIVIHPNPEIDFSGSPLSSCVAPLNVNFINNTTNASSFNWTFGDGSSSTSPAPSHNYTQQGNFTVKLTATSPNGCVLSKEFAQYVNIQPPVASIRSLPQKGCAPLVWTFEPSVFGGDSVVSYQWNFGDSTTSNEPRPTHTFMAGEYNITLIIVTASGCTDTVTYINGIKAGNKPHAAFSAAPRDVCAYLPVFFTDETPIADSVDQWLWHFGDGGTASTQNPQHIYTDTGFFDVRLIVYYNGCADTLIIPQYIHITPPIAAFGIVVDCKARLKRKFNDRSIGADSWFWEFGDGNTSTLQSPEHTYAASGSYIVKLTVHNDTTGCDFTKTTTILIVNELANFIASDTVICKPNPVEFQATQITPSYYALFAWNFGDNSTGTGTPITKIYYNSGIYNVTLITRDKNNCRDTIRKVQYIKVNGPIARFNTSSLNACANAPIQFRDSSSSDGRNPLVEWIWNYGDGNIDTSSTPNISHVYTLGGIYTVKLSIKDASGCTHQITKTNLITVHNPVAAFSTIDSIGCPGSNIQFNNGSNGMGLTYQWNFGDGLQSTVQHPVHQYTQVGLYNVTLQIRDQNGCIDTSVRSNMVNVVMPVPSFTISDSVGTCPPLIVHFTNQSQYQQSYSWDFGDGNTSATQDPSHFYSISGTFIPKLTVVGPGGCSASTTKRIVVRGPGGSFNYAGLNGCVPTSVQFRASTRGTQIFTWDFSDGTTQVTGDSLVSHVYQTPGSFLPRLILRDTAGCVVPLTGRDTIKIRDIQASFTMNQPVVCDRGDVQFSSTANGTDAVNQYQWSFGDGQTSTSANPSHTYVQTGTYTPQLIVTSTFGCTDTFRSQIPVRIITSPVISINQTANGCAPLQVQFTGNAIQGDTTQLNWNWNLGNQVQSGLSTPAVQTYVQPGTYQIRATATNIHGCRDTATTTVNVYAIPVVKTGMDTLVCKGTGITLSANGANSYSWSPSAGLSCSNCANPVANPANATTYIVTGTTPQGCSSSDTIKVSVQYPFDMTVSRGDSLCKGSSLRMSASGASSYSWYPTEGLDQSNGPTTMAMPNTTTNYRVIGSDDKGCFKDTAYVLVKVFQIPTVEAGADRTINVGQSIDLIPQVSPDVLSARWSPTGSIFRDIFPGITVKPTFTTTYTVVVKNNGGCTASDQLTVNVLCNGANMFIPNTFSPNNDGMNDVFYPRGSGIFTIKRIKVFNRWGEIVFEKGVINANDASQGWDGTFRGKKLNPDVYVYTVEVLCDNDTPLIFKGNVALIK